MNEHWLQWLAGVGVLIFGWIGKRLHDQVDDLRKTSVSRDELHELISDMHVERRQMHRENQETLDRIHERVDALWERPSP